MKQSRYRLPTPSLQLALALIVLCVLLWRKWKATDGALRDVLSEIARQFYVP